MLEILLIVVISKKIAALIKKKGRGPAGYIILFILFWFGGEIIGAVVGLAITFAQDPRAMNDDFNAVAYFFALIGAAIGGGLGYAVACSVPSLKKPRRDDFDDDEEDRDFDPPSDEFPYVYPVDERELEKPADATDGSRQRPQTQPNPVPPPRPWHGANLSPHKRQGAEGAGEV